MEKEYPWYKIVDSNEDLLQGDFIKECPVVILPAEISDKMEVRIINYDVVVMSQSCDLVQEKIDLVLVCPVRLLTEFGEKNPYYRGKDGKEGLRRGYLPGYHLLNKSKINGFETDYLVVDFRSVYSVPFDFVLELARKGGEGYAYYLHIESICPKLSQDSL